MAEPARHQWAQTVDRREIGRQQRMGWPDFGPEDFCHACGQRNPVWNAPTEQWETAARELPGGTEAIVCPTCFAEAWERATGRPVVWRMEVDPRAIPLLLEEGAPRG